MPSPVESERPHYSDVQRQSAEYIADLALNLRNTAKRNDLPFLCHLLEMAFYEAFTIANQVEPDMDRIAAKRQISDTS
jgi:hypothetical protein